MANKIKAMKEIFLILLLSVECVAAKAQFKNNTYWNSRSQLTPYRLPPPPPDYKPQYLNLDNDGDPDVLKSFTANEVPVMWIDDDDDMTYGDAEGDTDSDCLLIDRNKDGKGGSWGDLIIDWNDNDDDQKADMQVVVEYPSSFEKAVNAWPQGHYMWVMDTDRDNVLNYIDWNTFQIKSWEMNGAGDFLTDYSGNSTFLKIHTSSFNMNDLRLNWENPFLFYDPDGDGLSEMTVRLFDTPIYRNDTTADGRVYQKIHLSGTINWAALSVDLDNDNSSTDPFDFDFSLGFRGNGFNYMDQVHYYKAMRGLAAADTFFMDARWRQLTELIFPDRSVAQNFMFNRGKWEKAYFVFDEDDDCHRWERVEFYDPLDPFKPGANKGGIDNNSQADAAGDRGEWDLDNSGKGKLYISRFDGRLHLYGAEWGAWRIDQRASAYQGWDRLWVKREPEKFATVKYSDKNNNGFIDCIEYDLDGDSVFEQTVNFSELDIDDACTLIDVSNFKYKDYLKLNKKMSEQMWHNGQKALKVAGKYGLNTSWYAKIQQQHSLREKYNNGYWLQLYIYKDLADLFVRQNRSDMLKQLSIAYFSSTWDRIL